MKEIALKNQEKTSPPTIIIGTHCEKLGNFFWNPQIDTAIKKLEEIAKTIKNFNYINQIFKYSEKSAKKSILTVKKQIYENLQIYIFGNMNLINKNNKYTCFSFEILLIKNLLSKIRKTKKFLLWNEFIDLVFKNYEIESIKVFIDYFVSFGEILCFYFDDNLCNFVILDISWFICILNSISLNNNNNGIFIKKDHFSENLSFNFNDWELFNKIFSYFCIFISYPYLNDDYEYFSPLNIQSSTKINNNNLLPNIQNEFKLKNLSYYEITKNYYFNEYPIDFLNKVIFKILEFSKYYSFPLQFHDLINKDSFYLFCNEKINFHLIIEKLEENNYLKISLFYLKNIDENINMISFIFREFLFNLPFEIIYYYKNKYNILQKIILCYDNEEIGEENQLISENYKDLLFFISNHIQIYNINEINLNYDYFLYEENDIYIWQSKLNEKDVLFKEVKTKNYKSYSLLKNEIQNSILLKNCNYILQFFGFCTIDENFLKSREKWNEILQISNIKDNCDNHVFSIFEKSNFGSLENSLSLILHKSVCFKLKIALDVCKAVENIYLSFKMKIIHSNVNLSNIYLFSLDDNEEINNYNSIHVKLGGLHGIITNPIDSNSLQLLHVLNQRYIAPEIVKGDLITSKIDVFSFGIVFLEILTCKIAINYKILLLEINDNKNIPIEIKNLISQCLHENPNERPDFYSIISILTGLLYNFDNNSIENFENSLKITELSTFFNEFITSDHFFNVKVIHCSKFSVIFSALFKLNNESINVTLKMLVNPKIEFSTHNHRRLIENEYLIVPKIENNYHPNIARYLGFFQTIPSFFMLNNVNTQLPNYSVIVRHRKEFQFFFIEEYEKTLSNIIHELDEIQIIKYLNQFLSALIYLFDNNIVHLDISLDNLMISSSDNLIVIDFGSAGKLSENYFVSLQETCGGNLYHLAPEVINSRDDGTDLPCLKQYSWEFGVILYELFSKGKFPFKDYGYQFCFNSSSIDLSPIPTKFHHLCSLLLCEHENRIHITDVHKYFNISQ